MAFILTLNDSSQTLSLGWHQCHCS